MKRIINFALVKQMVMVKIVEPKHRHKKSGKVYTKIFDCKLKVDGEWHPAVTYMSEESSEIYVRKLSDFMDKFQPIRAN